MHPLAERVLDHIRRQELLQAGDRVGVAVSGGIDSVALLRLMLELRGELGIVLSVVHFNHKLRGAESDADEQFVAALAREHDLEFCVDSDDVAGHAREEGISVEAAARDVRYGFLRFLLREEGCSPGARLQGNTTSVSSPIGAPQGRDETARHGSAGEGDTRLRESGHGRHASATLDKIATGHTLDDQAETVLMRMIRGTGLRGLGGIYPGISVENAEGEICGEIVRPLLAFRRRELEQYLREIGQCWREDSTNTDESLTRNRVRRLVLPLLEKEFNPAVAENLAELAEIARGEEDYWANEIAGWMGTTVHWSEPEWAKSAARRLVQFGAADKGSEPDVPWLAMNASVNRLWLLGEPQAVQRRVVKAICEEARIPLEFKHVEEILRFAGEDGNPGRELSLPLGWKLRRERDEIIFLTPDLREPVAPSGYEYELPIPGIITVNETHSQIEAQRVPADRNARYNFDQLLDAESLPGALRVRNWRPGDRFWPGHTKSPKKIKELFEERHVPQAERGLWPVVVKEGAHGEEIIWVRGFRLPAKLRAKPGRAAILILEKPLTTAPAT